MSCRCLMSEEEKKEDTRLKRNIITRNYYNRNKEKLALKRKEYYDKNKDKIRNTTDEWKKNNKERILEKKKEYFQKNKESIYEKHSLLMKSKVSCSICNKEYSYSYIKRHISHIHPDIYLKQHNII